MRDAFTVTATIHHGNYRATHTAEIRDREDLAWFFGTSSYFPNPNAVERIWTELEKSRKSSHGWVDFVAALPPKPLTVTQHSALGELNRWGGLAPSRTAWDPITGRRAYSSRTLQALVDAGHAEWAPGGSGRTSVLPVEPVSVEVSAYLHTPSDPDEEPYWVVQVDTDEDTPLRVYINDGSVYVQ